MQISSISQTQPTIAQTDKSVISKGRLLISKLRNALSNDEIQAENSFKNLIIPKAGELDFPIIAYIDTKTGEAIFEARYVGRGGVIYFNYDPKKERYSLGGESDTTDKDFKAFIGGQAPASQARFKRIEESFGEI